MVADRAKACFHGKIVRQLAIHPGSSGTPAHRVAVTLSKDGGLIGSDSRLRFQLMCRASVGRVLQARRDEFMLIFRSPAYRLGDPLKKKVSAAIWRRYSRKVWFTAFSFLARMEGEKRA